MSELVGRANLLPGDWFGYREEVAAIRAKLALEGRPLFDIGVDRLLPKTVGVPSERIAAIIADFADGIPDGFYKILLEIDDQKPFYVFVLKKGWGMNIGGRTVKDGPTAEWNQKWSELVELVEKEAP